MTASTTYSRKELGDFQTPPDLVDRVLDCLFRDGIHWSRALEPTCGVGNFIAGLCQRAETVEIVGIEIDPTTIGKARSRFPAEVRLLNESLFEVNLRAVEWRSREPLLVVGNPPWVTNSELSALQSNNLPQKRNLKNLNGLDAITGSANFDIAEYIWLQLIEGLSGERATIALLCKTSVARKVIQFVRASAWPVSAASVHRIDSKEHFQVSADACLLRLELSKESAPFAVPEFESLEATTPRRTLGFSRDNQLIADATLYEKVGFADQVSPLEWRQGLKHDAAKVMELVCENRSLLNGYNEIVDVEADYVFPLAKGSDLFHDRTSACARAVIVPQRLISADNSHLEVSAPRLWHYLNSHKSAFDSRKSAIYRSSPFAIFGVGDYSFAPYKVAISGLHKTPWFRLIGPIGGKPVMLDDTSYFLPFRDPRRAALAQALLSSRIVSELIQAIVFWDSKRPITKRVLMRIGLTTAMHETDPVELASAANTELQALSLDADRILPEELPHLLSDDYRDRETSTRESSPPSQPRLLDKADDL